MPFRGIALCLTAIFCCWATQTSADGFVCGGNQGEETISLAAKPTMVAQTSNSGSRRGLVLFARFKGEAAQSIPSWAADIFNPVKPGSFSHFYDAMSFGKLQVRGEVGPRVYESLQPASAYLSSDPAVQGRFGEFTQEILRQADQDINLAQFDGDGPDGVPNSGDDDGVVDAVFLVLASTPRYFLLGTATGIGTLGFEEVLSAAIQGKGGNPFGYSPVAVLFSRAAASPRQSGPCATSTGTCWGCRTSTTPSS